MMIPIHSVFCCTSPGESAASIYYLYLGASHHCIPISKCRGWGELVCDSAEYASFREKGSLGMYCLDMIQSGLVSLTCLFCLVSQIVAF